jgi:O-methyltransferase
MNKAKMAAAPLSYLFGGFPLRQLNYAKQLILDRIRPTQRPWANDKTPTLVHSQVVPTATYSPWLSDEEFKAVHEKIKDHTLVDVYRCYELWSIARQLIDVSGCILEVGVWRGGTGALLAEAMRCNRTKKVYLADTFRGVVKAGERDTSYKGGEHADTSKSLVEALLSQLSLSNVTLLEGVFPEDTSHYVSEPVALLHCDVDVYSSTKDIVEWALPRLSKGGAIVFDDYGFVGCEGVTRFANELRPQKDLLFIHNLNGHAIFIKT